MSTVHSLAPAPRSAALSTPFHLADVGVYGFDRHDTAILAALVTEDPLLLRGAESVLIDELSHCKPEHQNGLFSLVHECRLQRLPLAKLHYRWAAMNPCASDQGGVEDCSGSEALEPLRDGGLARVRQFLTACVIRGITLE